MTEATIEHLVEEARARAADKRRSFVWSPDGAAAPPAPERAPPGRPLEVLLADTQRTLFSYVRDPRLNIRTHRPGARLEALPDVVVLTRMDRTKPAASAAGLPAEAWAALSDGRAVLVFDSSGEGLRFHPASADELHRFLRARGVPLAKTAYVTQDRGWRAAYDAYCDAQGLGRERLCVWIHDLYIQRGIAEASQRGEGAFRRRLGAYAARGKRRRKRFISLNRTIRPVKALFLLKLMQQGLFDAGYISLGIVGEVSGGKVVSLDEFGDMLTRVHGLGHLAAELRPYLEQLAAIGPVSLGSSDEGAEKPPQEAALRPVPFREYAKTWFTVVTESEASDRLHRITEKPLKPILNFHPFLVLGSMGSLRLLRAYGFETFRGMFHEAYDEALQRRVRFDAVFEETRRLCLVSEAAMARRDERVAPQVVFNAWWALMELPALFHSHIEARLIDDLVELWASRP